MVPAAVVLIVLLLQIEMDVAASAQLRYEELGESIRNPYWLENHLICDGISSNFGYYSVLLAAYKWFGFSLYTAKYVKLLLLGIALLALFRVLNRWMSVTWSSLLVITYGSAPVLLYFNGLQTAFGMDLIYTPIILLLLVELRFDRSWRDILLHAASGITVVIAATSYPSFITYIPSLVLVYGLRMQYLGVHPLHKDRSTGYLSGILGVALPFIWIVWYADNWEILWHDPVTGRGLFRGGGQFNLEWSSLWGSLVASLRDLFSTGRSFYYELPSSGFNSLMAQLIYAAFVIWGWWIGRHSSPYRKAFVVIVLLALISVLLPSLSNWLPGLRRSTGLVFSLYAMGGLTIWVLLRSSGRWTVILIGMAAFIWPVHQLSIFKGNAHQMEQPSIYSNLVWFSADDDPTLSLLIWEDQVKNGLPLRCPETDHPYPQCRFPEIYAVIQGKQVWNGRPPLQIHGIRERDGEKIELSIGLWTPGNIKE